jgi:hypothetical protein
VAAWSLAGRLRSLGNPGRRLADRNRRADRAGRTAVSAVPLVAGTCRRLEHQRHGDGLSRSRRAGRAFSTQTTFAISRKLGPRAELFAEYVGEYPIHAGASQILNTGAVYHLTPLQQIDFHFAFGLNQNAPAYTLGIGYSFRIDRLF